MKELTEELVDAMERLIESVDRLNDAGQERIAKITATVDADAAEREAALLRRLDAAEARIAELTAAAARKTSMVRKHSSAAAEPVEPAALDSALSSLSVEQRLAVKAELLRSGAIA